MRILYKNTSGIEEITHIVNRFSEDAFTFSYVVGDYFYLLSDAPFNHYFLSFNGGNVNVTSMQIEYMSSNGWQVVANNADYTDLWAKTGVVEFTPDRNYPWAVRSTNYGGQTIPGLESINIYDVYALRISFTNDLSPNLKINYMGHVFNDDIDLYSEYPIFNDAQFLTAFKVGKDNWEEQSIRAAELIIKDLKSKGLIYSPGQILQRELFREASIQKTAEIIFRSFGNDYVDQCQRARKEYEYRMDVKNFVIDQNNNGVKDGFESQVSSGWLSR
jgi:hypothetical protein